MTVDMHHRVHNYLSNGRRALTPRQVRRTTRKSGLNHETARTHIRATVDAVTAQPCRLCWAYLGTTTDTAAFHERHTHLRIGTGNTGRLYVVPAGTKP